MSQTNLRPDEHHDLREGIIPILELEMVDLDWGWMFGAEIVDQKLEPVSVRTE